MKTSKQQHSGNSGLVNTSRCLEGGVPGEGVEALGPSLHTCPTYLLQVTVPELCPLQQTSNSK